MPTEAASDVPFSRESAQPYYDRFLSLNISLPKMSLLPFLMTHMIAREFFRLPSLSSGTRKFLLCSFSQSSVFLLSITLITKTMAGIHILCNVRHAS